MLREKINEMKSIIEKDTDKNNKKKIENLVVFIIILIITILAINMIWKKDDGKAENSMYTQLADDEKKQNSNINESNEYNLEKDLEDILSKISGAGKVKALITYSESSQIVPISNEKYKATQTEESDKTGGTRKIEETDQTSEIIYQETGGKKEIITRKSNNA